MEECASKRKFQWTNQETELLLHLWAKRMKGTSSKNHAQIIYEIQQAMRQISTEKTEAEIRNTIKNLANRYRQELAAIETNGVMSEWQWFLPVHDILQGEPVPYFESDVEEKIVVKNCAMEEDTWQDDFDSSHSKEMDIGFENETETARKKKPRFGWSDEKHEIFFQLWAKKIKDPSYKDKRGKLCRDIAVLMSTRYPTITKTEVLNKIKNLMQVYRKEMRALEGSSELTSEWPFFKIVHDIVSDNFDNDDLSQNSYESRKHLAENEMSRDAAQHAPSSPDAEICRKKRRFIWEDEQLEMLLDCWRQNINDPDCKKQRGMLYRVIAEKMSLKCPTITKNEVVHKIKNLMRQYRKELKTIEFGGGPSSWPYFSYVHEILREQPAESFIDLEHDANSSTNLLEEVQVVNCQPDFLQNNESSEETDLLAEANVQQRTFHDLVIEKFDRIDQRLKDQLEQQKSTDKAMLQLENRKVELFEKLVKDHAELKDAIIKKLTTPATENNV